jgi:hypothetical protein
MYRKAVILRFHYGDGKTRLIGGLSFLFIDRR